MKARLVFFRNQFIYQYYRISALFLNTSLPKDISANFVVSIASYPKRDDLLPAVFQALSRQTVLPNKWILVLSEEDYPNGLPNHLQKLVKRGLEIIWSKNNPFAVKKLIPTMEKYPHFGVITFDDELIYGNGVVEKLITQSKKFPRAIIGHVGKEMIKLNGKLGMMNRSGKPASLDTPSTQVYFLGGSGTFYPANSLDKKVFDLEKIHEIVPGRGSDIWFWAAAVANNTKQICLGTNPDINLYFSIPSNDLIKPLDQPGEVVMEGRFQMAVDYFGIRDKLWETLPNIGQTEH